MMVPFRNRVMGGSMALLMLSVAWFGGFDVAVAADSPGEAYFDPAELTYDSVEEFRNSSSNQPTSCEYAPVSESWCEPVEFNPFGINDTPAMQWFDAQVEMWLFHFVNAIFRTTTAFVNVIAPFAYFLKTTIGTDATVFIGKAGMYAGMGGMVLGQLWNVKRLYQGGED